MDEELEAADDLTLEDLLDRAAAGRPVEMARHRPTRVERLTVSGGPVGVLVHGSTSTIADTHVVERGVFVS
jgi:hypothetical protein